MSKYEYYFLNDDLITRSGLNIPFLKLSPSNDDSFRKLMKGRSGIYCWVSLSNNKMYIGSAKCLWRRFNNYYLCLESNCLKCNVKLLSHIKKYGSKDLKFCILEYHTCTKKSLQTIEQDYFDQYSPFHENGFNISESAFRPLNCPISKEGRLKISEAISGEKNALSKLRTEDVIFIKKSLSVGTKLKTLSRQFGVSTTVISNIKRGKSWGHVLVDKETQDQLCRSTKENERKYSKELREEISERIRNGERMTDLSKEYNIKYTTINNIKLRHCK